LPIAIFLLLCLSSYHPLDASFTHFVVGKAKTHNLIGFILGSYTADSLLRLLGIGAFWLPVVLSIISFKYFLDETFKISPVGMTAVWRSNPRDLRDLPQFRWPILPFMG